MGAKVGLDGLTLDGGTLPDAPHLAAALVLGSASYGASIVLDAGALRFVGAAREAAYFATAPFVGALASLSPPRRACEVENIDIIISPR